MKTLISIITLSLGLLCFAESRTVGELHDGDTVITKESNGSAKMLPKYLWTKDFYDSYTNDAAWYYSQPQDYGHCSAMRDGDFLYRNLDWKFNDSADVIVRMFAGEGRFASVGVANCGTNLTEEIIASGVPSRYFKCLPGRTVDGINECGVCAEVNVVNGNPQTSGWHTSGNLHPLAAVRWILDHATNAAHGAEYIAANIHFPEGWTQNFHYMISDKHETWIVENGVAGDTYDWSKPILTNYRCVDSNGQYDPHVYEGQGIERYEILIENGNITNVWYTNAYSSNTSWRSDFDYNDTLMATSKVLWAQKPKEKHRGEYVGGYSWWQTVHTSIYDLKNMTLKIAVQEQDDWYVIQMPNVGGVKVESDPTVPAWAKQANPPEGMTDNALVLANGAVKTKSGTAIGAANVGAYPNASGVSLAQSVQVLGLHLQAEDARVTVTNYNSNTKDPSMYLEYKVTEGAEAGTWKIVWNELTRWNKLLDDILPNNYYNKSQVDSMVNNIPWGTWDSQTGGYAPDKTISMSADRVILCKGASYQRTVTAQGSYFVWTANMPYEVTGIESNGFFRIEDAEGNVTFEIVKGDKVTAAANPDGLYTEQVMGITHLHIHYPIEAETHPELEICDNLTTHDWKLESDSSCIANVTWTGTSGNYYAEVWGKTSKSQIFVKGTYQKGSDPYVRYSSALDVQQLRIGGVIYNVGTATISGHTVLTLTPAN